jgi:hypothetical protein
MDTLGKVMHEVEVADVSERKLRLEALTLAIQAAPHKPDDVPRIAAIFLNFLLGLNAGKDHGASL